MSEQFNEAVADQLGQIGAATAGPGSGVDLDAAAAQSGAAPLGVTESDLASLFAQIKDMQARLDRAEAQRQADAPPQLVSVADTIAHYAGVHNDPKALELVADLQAAAGNATESGDTGPLTRIGERLAKHLARNRPHPGDNHHYDQLVDWVSNHLPDAVDSFVPPAPASAAAVGSDRAPAKVVAGSVVG